jgi:hypothetical protein
MQDEPSLHDEIASPDCVTQPPQSPTHNEKEFADDKRRIHSRRSGSDDFTGHRLPRIQFARCPHEPSDENQYHVQIERE